MPSSVTIRSSCLQNTCGLDQRPAVPVLSVNSEEVISPHPQRPACTLVSIVTVNSEGTCSREDVWAHLGHRPSVVPQQPRGNRHRRSWGQRGEAFTQLHLGAPDSHVCCGVMIAGTTGHFSILVAAHLPRLFLTEPSQRFLSACKLIFPSCCMTLWLCVILRGLPCLGWAQVTRLCVALDGTLRLVWCLFARQVHPCCVWGDRECWTSPPILSAAGPVSSFLLPSQTHKNLTHVC